MSTCSVNANQILPTNNFFSDMLYNPIPGGKHVNNNFHKQIGMRSYLLGKGRYNKLCK